MASTLSHPTVIPYGRGKAILQPTVCHLERNDVGSPLIAGCFCVESITSRYLDRVGREENLAIECPIARFFNYLFLALLVPAWQLTLSFPQLSHTLSPSLSPHTRQRSEPEKHARDRERDTHAETETASTRRGSRDIVRCREERTAEGSGQIQVHDPLFLSCPSHIGPPNASDLGQR